MITLTDKAAEKVDDLIKSEESSEDEEFALRVSVRPGGCSGYNYEMYFDSQVSDADEKVSYGGVSVVMDSASASILKDATLDFKDGLEGGFSIDNPNAQRTCGCGKSFS